eukprot:CAMPEP_0194066566 /NCGR_PEP_ID=MMETSP0009_2-20130614/86090_1 /TAXON_ID=210454 /ORGANISM="Grammatophora oceanica, Strain CCMP 410" /LENGTH=639 /DNA_ID=CAMNT_0038719531 /DNA_START=135 /DNA_END=2054 /DNA_ORIENTATION=-
MKLRGLRSLLPGQGKLRNNNSNNGNNRQQQQKQQRLVTTEASFDEFPEAEASSTSSGTLSRDEAEFDRYGTTTKDPYADVRDRMEALAARDKAIFAHHSADTSTTAGAVEGEPMIPFFAAYTTYLGYVVLIVCGHIRDIFAKIIGRGRYVRKTQKSFTASSYPSDDTSVFAPLLKSWENFYTRRLYHRIQDCFNRPIASNPGSRIKVLERVSADGNKTMELLGSLDNLENEQQMHEYTSGAHYVQVVSTDNEQHSKEVVARDCLNLGSYNYLGFADDWDVTCQTEVLASLTDFSVSTSASRTEFGSTSLHRQVERTVSDFLKKEDAMCFNMGFNTNATTIPALVTRGDLIVSDSLNHTSIVNGARASGAAIRTFRHNDTKQLEQILEEAIVMGRPRTRRPWNRILVIVEGIYSMEGEYCDLRNVVRVSKKYGAYVYLDEAHSIGAMGPTGRGCAEYTGVDTKDIDIMMGTFTKSFGGMGGYIAASKEVIEVLRRTCAGSAEHNALSPVVCQQIITSFKVIMGRDGTNIGKQKLRALRDNSNYFRMKLTEMGLHVLGHYDSPVMPVMLYNPTKIAAFSRECMKRGLAVVVVGFPAVPILMSRARFCISAGHTRPELDRALLEIDEIADILKLRYDRSTFG